MEIEQQVEQELLKLYSGTGDKSAEQNLLNYQSNPHFWPNSLNLLTANSPNTQFFGAQSLYNTLLKDWAKLDEESLCQIQSRIAQLLSWPSFNPPQFVRHKLCSVLAIYTIKQLPKEPKGIEVFCGTFLENRDQTNNLFLVLQYLTAIPEELEKYCFVAINR